MERLQAGCRFVQMMRMMMLGVMIVSTVKGQGLHTGLLSGSTVLGGRTGSLWGEIVYPAAMGKADPGIGIFGEKRYLSNFNYFELGARASLGSYPVQLRLCREGNAAYSDLQASLSVGQKITEQLSLALRAGYTLSQAKGYAGRGNATAGLGAIFRMNEKCVWGLQADGINSFFSGNDQAYFAVRTGLGYRVSDLAALTIEVVKENQYPVFPVAGLSYSFTGKMRANLGYALTLGSFMFGISFQHAGAEIALNTSYHSSLGPSAGVSLVYQFKTAE